MTASEKVRWLQSLPGETISPKELAAVAGGTPYSYNMAAKNGNLDLPHLWRGRNLRIWKWPVIRLIGGENVQEIQDCGRKTDEGQDDDGRSEGTICHWSYDDWLRNNGFRSSVGSCLMKGDCNERT